MTERQSQHGTNLAPGAPPERPFIRSDISDSDPAVVAALEQTIDPKTLEVTQNVAGIMGGVMQGKIQQSIVKLRKPPNFPVTIACKRWKTNPLINTGVMNGSVTYKVDD